jgi:hypothetical protein
MTASAAIHPAYQQLADLIFSGVASFEEKVSSSKGERITLTEDTFVNGNRLLPTGTRLYVKKPAEK